ncbi:DUF1489 domain-containing protein [Thalassospiraceae bacterium LMO-JJ14]|nr:DUF1489 domain-containing protein [Thalassospiraceae bacterium LMO-JJ14]
MSVNLIKLCVGIENLAHLKEVQQRRLELKRKSGEAAELMHVTRSFPRRAAEVLDGGSLYWVIKGVIRVRQRIIDLRETVNKDGNAACAIVYDADHIQTVPRPFRAFQGWRYLDPGDAPRDLDDVGAGADELPEDMADELRNLGLL